MPTMRTENIKTIGDSCEFIRGRSYSSADLGSEGVPLYGLGTIVEGGGFKCNSIKMYGGKIHPSQVLRAGDTYVANTSLAGQVRPFIGSPAIVPTEMTIDGVATHHVSRVKWKTEDLNVRRKIKWILHSTSFRNHCMNYSTGTTVFTTTPKDMARFKSLLDCLERINLVIKSLDSAAEKAEKTAQLLFNTLYEGIDILALQDSLQDDNNGWRKFRLADIMSIKRGLSYNAKHLTKGEGVEFHTVKSIFEGGGYKRSGLKWYNGDYKEHHKIKADDIIISTLEQSFDHALVGRCARIPTDLSKSGIFSGDIFKVNPNEGWLDKLPFIYHLLSHARVHAAISSYSNGTTINRIPADSLERPVVQVPSDEVINTFVSRANVLHHMADKCRLKERNWIEVQRLLIDILGMRE